MFNFFRLAAPVACLGVLAACDNSAPSVPADAVEPATPIAAAAPVTAASVLASLDADAVCDVLSMALSTKDNKVSDDGCTAVPGESGVTLTTADGVQTVLAPLALAGATVQVTAVNASSAAVENVIGPHEVVRVQC